MKLCTCLPLQTEDLQNLSISKACGAVKMKVEADHGSEKRKVHANPKMSLHFKKTLLSKELILLESQIQFYRLNLID